MNILQNPEKIALVKTVLQELGVPAEALDEALIRELDAGISTFMSNPSWAEHYNVLPNKMLQVHQLLSWANSAYFSRKLQHNPRIRELMKLLKGHFTREDWQGLIATTGNITAKINYSKQMNLYFKTVDNM